MREKEEVIELPIDKASLAAMAAKLATRTERVSLASQVNRVNRKALSAKIKFLKTKFDNETCAEAEIAEVEAEIACNEAEASMINVEMAEVTSLLKSAEAQGRLLMTMEAHGWWYQQQPKIQRPPGSLMLRIAEILVSKKRYERDCQAAFADWNNEYFEALDQERGKAKMAAIRIRHSWAFLKSTGCLVVLEMVGKLVAKLVGKIGGA